MKRRDSLHRIGTPTAIEVLLHCHTCPTPHPRREAPAVADALSLFRVLGVIELSGSDDAETTTQLGKAWVEALCRVPLPRMAYVDEQGEVLL